MSNLPPLTKAQANQPKPVLPDKMLTLQEYLDYIDDLACWKATKAEALLSGVSEE